MDDWPRTSDDELYISKYNIDASTWMYFFSNSMAEIAGTLGYSDD